MDDLHVSVVPQIDDAALKQIGEQIRMTVAQAVRDGINDAQLREPEQYDRFSDPGVFAAKLKERQNNV